MWHGLVVPSTLRIRGPDVYHTVDSGLDQQREKQILPEVGDYAFIPFRNHDELGKLWGSSVGGVPAQFLLALEFVESTDSSPLIQARRWH